MGVTQEPSFLLFPCTPHTEICTRPHCFPALPLTLVLNRVKVGILGSCVDHGAQLHTTLTLPLQHKTSPTLYFKHSTELRNFVGAGVDGACRKGRVKREQGPRGWTFAHKFGQGGVGWNTQYIPLLCIVSDLPTVRSLAFLVWVEGPVATP
jgi:hypothetical protein